MLEVQNKIVSIETFRATRLAERSADTTHRERASGLSQRSIEHRERMLRFLREATRKEAAEVQGCLLL